MRSLVERGERAVRTLHDIRLVADWNSVWYWSVSECSMSVDSEKREQK
jgi:hypothetical protein